MIPSVNIVFENKFRFRKSRSRACCRNFFSLSQILPNVFFYALRVVSSVWMSFSVKCRDACENCAGSTSVLNGNKVYVST